MDSDEHFKRGTQGGEIWNYTHGVFNSLIDTATLHSCNILLSITVCQA